MTPRASLPSLSRGLCPRVLLSGPGVGVRERRDPGRRAHRQADCHGGTLHDGLRRTPHRDEAEALGVSREQSGDGGGAPSGWPDAVPCGRPGWADIPGRGMCEIMRWVLGWDDAGGVVRPPALRREVAAMLRRAATRYSTLMGDSWLQRLVVRGPPFPRSRRSSAP